MSHRRRRASRVFLAALGAVIAVGLIAYALRHGSRKSDEAKTVAAATTEPATQPAPATAPTTAPGTSAEPAPVAAAQSSRPEALAALVTETPSVPTIGTTAETTPAAAAPVASPPKVEVQQANGQSAVPAAANVPASSPNSGPGPTPTPAIPAAGIVAEGRSRVAAGKLLEARDLVNGALAAGRLQGADVAAARQLLAEINQTVVFSPRRFADDKWGGTYSVQSGDRFDRIGSRYGLTPALLMRLNNISDARRLRAGATIKVLKGPFHAIVSKSNFRLDLYLGAPGGPDSVYVTSFPVGLGKDDSTPKGKWLVEPQKKIKNPVYYSPRGEGITDADDPKNPLGEYWIGLAGTDGDAIGKSSYGIHGTIEPDSIGKMASMGCIRLRNEDVARVYEMLVEGESTVVVQE